jgi:Fe-S-cluster-containing hydrogenase component 2
VKGLQEKGLKKTGTPDSDELKAARAFPTEERLLQGPFAVIECIEEIPCNPCETVCPMGAITVGVPITNLPVIDFEKCTGCGICIPMCPGLAICVKDFSHSENKAAISFPFEYLPLPAKGDTVKVADRYGDALCDGVVVRVFNGKRNDRTAVVTVEFAKDCFHDAVTIQRLK